MYTYFFYNWDETKQVLVGTFASDEIFRQYVSNNVLRLEEEMKKLDSGVWHWVKF